MPSIQLGLFALPNGASADGKRLRVSVVVAPRLSGGTKLSDFGDVEHWTHRVAGKGVTVTLSAGGKSLTTHPIPPTLGPAGTKPTFRPDLWDALFPGDVPVEPHSFDDYRGRLVVSYPVLTTLAALKHVYQLFGVVAPEELPVVVPRESAHLRGVVADPRPALLASSLAPFDLWQEHEGETAASVRAGLRKAALERQQQRGGAFAPTPTGPVGPDGVPTAAPAAGALAEARDAYTLFHSMPVPDHKTVPAPTADEAAARYDFHAALTALHAYPALMRALGLILDLEVDAAALPASPGASGYETIQVTQLHLDAWAVKPSLDAPATRYLHETNGGAARFSTAPSTLVVPGGAPEAVGDVWNGCLHLDPAAFHLTQLDVDGATRQLLTYAEGVNQAQGRSEAPGGLPATRSAGLGLTIDGRAAWLLDTFERNGALIDASGSSSLPPLTTLDVVRGWRVDVWWSRSDEWHSLHERLATYAAGADGAAAIELDQLPEEGFLQPSATSSLDPAAENDLYVHERLLRWSGWSLSAPKPAKALNRSADPADALADDPTEGEPVTAFKLRTTFEAKPGSLPRLRFGDRYRMRLRAVDLAGNSLPFTEQELPDGSTLPAAPDGVPYLRFQPVPAPVVVPRDAKPGPGESTVRLVIRSFNDEPDKDGVATTETSERHIAPPKTTLQLAEEHGALDSAPGLDAQATYDLVTGRDANGPPPVATGAKLDVAWLPDPLSRGAALRGLPGIAPPAPEQRPDDPQAAFVRVPFDGTWPDPKPFRFSLAEGDGPPAWDATKRVLGAFVPKGTMVDVRLSSFVDDGDLGLLGAWRWLVEAFEAFYLLGAASGDPGIAQAIEAVVTPWQRIAALAPLGGLWLLTPYHQLTLVHAVQQPLGRPRFVSTLLPAPGDAGLYPGIELPLRPLSAWRAEGSHDAYLFGAVRFHASSTAKLEVTAAWTDPVDDPSESPQAKSTVADVLNLTALDSPLMTAAGGRQTGRYAAGEALAKLPDVEHGLGQPDTTAPDAALMGLENDIPVAARHQLGDTRHRVITYRAIATSRFRDYFDRNDPSLDFTRTSDPVQVDVPSSAPPLAPKLVSVLPAFAWTRNVTPQLATSIRRGGVLRVHLARPWFSSGEGELLGVLCRSTGLQQPSTSEWLSRHVSVWGQDPIWRSRRLADYPSQSDFPARLDPALDATREAVPLPGADPSGSPVAVAAHAVGYDRERGLMYADVEISAPDTYAPFLRLALARYQPFSIPGVSLSPVVLADIAQLTADRTAVLATDPVNPQTFMLSVSGIQPETPIQAPALSNVVRVEVERRLPGRTDELGWEPAAAAATVTPLPPSATTDTLLWTGFVELAEPPGDDEFRIAVREFEVFRADDDSAWPDFGYGDVHLRVGGRLVYAEYVPLPAAR
jgi:hypothetical protein